MRRKSVIRPLWTLDFHWESGLASWLAKSCIGSGLPGAKWPLVSLSETRRHVTLVGSATRDDETCLSCRDLSKCKVHRRDSLRNWQLHGWKPAGFLPTFDVTFCFTSKVEIVVGICWICEQPQIRGGKWCIPHREMTQSKATSILSFRMCSLDSWTVLHPKVHLSKPRIAIWQEPSSAADNSRTALDGWGGLGPIQAQPALLQPAGWCWLHVLTSSLDSQDKVMRSVKNPTIGSAFFL